jgi:hypothetical protein
MHRSRARWRARTARTRTSPSRWAGSLARAANTTLGSRKPRRASACQGACITAAILRAPTPFQRLPQIRELEGLCAAQQASLEEAEERYRSLADSRDSLRHASLQAKAQLVTTQAQCAELRTARDELAADVSRLEGALAGLRADVKTRDAWCACGLCGTAALLRVACGGPPVGVDACACPMRLPLVAIALPPTGPPASWSWSPPRRAWSRRWRACSRGSGRWSRTGRSSRRGRWVGAPGQLACQGRRLSSKGMGASHA